MRQKILLSPIILAVTLTILLPQPVLGENIQDSNLKLKHEQIQLKKKEVVQKREEKKVQLTEKHKQRIENIYQRIQNKLEFRIKHLHKLGERIENRYSFWEEKGYQTAESQVLLNDAYTHINQAEADLSLVVSQLEALLNSDDPKSLLPDLRASLKEVKDSLTLARQTMSQAVNLLVSQKGDKNEE